MVHTTSAIAFAVLALNAASTLARPVSFDADLVSREFDQEVEARDFEFADYEFEAREPEYEVDARDFDFDVEERDFEVEAEILERATPTTTTSVKATPSTTTSTHIVKPTGKNQKASKTVVVTVHEKAKTCKKPGLLTKLRTALKTTRAHTPVIPLTGRLTAAQEHRVLQQLRLQRLREQTLKTQLKKQVARVQKVKAVRAAKAKATATTSGTANKVATPTPSGTATANWSSITQPPTPKGVKVNEKTTVGKDKVTTIVRTVTAAPTACPTAAAKKVRRDVEDISDLLERAYSFEDLD